jgi:hypothetical protein
MFRNNDEKPNTYIPITRILQASSSFKTVAQEIGEAIGLGIGEGLCVPARDGEMGGSCPDLGMAQFPPLWFPLPWP